MPLGGTTVNEPELSLPGQAVQNEFPYRPPNRSDALRARSERVRLLPVIKYVRRRTSLRV
jgi:hypothetical protein